MLKQPEQTKQTEQPEQTEQTGQTEQPEQTKQTEQPEQTKQPEQTEPLQRVIDQRLSPRPSFSPGLALFNVDVMGKAECTLGHDVALHRPRATTDGEGG